MRMRGIIIGAAIGTAIGVTAARLGRWRRTWGIEPGEGTRPLAGDDIVASATAVETRGITIDAPPEAVWPWLVQMGYGRAGWYSYDQLDQRGASADAIVQAWQTLAVGDIVPTHPGGGFEVALLDPGRALVLRTDTALVTAQAEAAKAAGTSLDAGTAGVRVSGAMLSSTPQQFAASWAFVLEPVEGGRTRFIERFRASFEAGSPGSSLIMPLLGFGVFVMLQKQMVGIRDRAEGRGAAGPLRVELPDAAGAAPDVVDTIEDVALPPEPVTAS